MTRSDRYADRPAAESFGASAELAPHLLAASYAVVSGKLSRFLARNIVIKKLAMRNARPLVSFTFDDAAASACSTGALIVQQHQARATFYISGGKCGAPSPTGRLATVDQIKLLHAQGHEIGCHTYSHTPVVPIGRAALDDELARNRSFFQDLLGAGTLRNFAYPYGNMSFATKRYLGARFDSCRAHIPGINAGVADLALLRSYALEKASIDRRGILQLIGQTVSRNGWLIFACHDVDNEPSRFGVEPDLLAFALRAARDAGCQLVTMAEALRLARSETTSERVA